MLKLVDRKVWTSVYDVLGLSLPYGVTHSIWCLRAQSLVLTQLHRGQDHKPQKPQTAHYLLTSSSVQLPGAANPFCKEAVIQAALAVRTSGLGAWHVENDRQQALEAIL